MALNINREVEDTFYRYKMPKLQAKVEGKGNGIKTVVVNVSDIARALYRKPIYLIKYFGCELGAQVNVDENNDRYIVNGAHDASKLQQLLDGFIKKFVLCQKCGNPETDLTVKKRAEMVKSTCKACGASKFLDAQHRLTQYIIKNPPEEPTKTKAKKTKGDSDEDGAEASGNPIVLDVGEAEAEDDDWGEDVSEDARRERLEALGNIARALSMSTDLDKTKKERAQLFLTYLKSLLKSDGLIGNETKICDEADRLDLGSRAVLVLVEMLLTNAATVVNQLKAHASLFRQLIASCDTPGKAQMSMLNVLVTLSDKVPDMQKKVATLLKTMYDLNIVDEEMILQWADKGPSSKYGPKKLHAEILAKCNVFFIWLREAEEESSEEEKEEGGGEDAEEEEEEDDEDEADANGANATNNNVPAKKEASPEPASDQKDDDLDIDAI